MFYKQSLNSGPPAKKKRRKNREKQQKITTQRFSPNYRSHLTIEEFRCFLAVNVFLTSLSMDLNTAAGGKET